jgi:hypothetical protein
MNDKMDGVLDFYQRNNVVNHSLALQLVSQVETLDIPLDVE